MLLILCTTVSNTHKFYCQLVAQCFYMYYTKFLQVSAIYPGHFRRDASYALHVDQISNSLKMVRIYGRNT